MRNWIILFLLFFCLSFSLQAKEAQPMAEDPVIEKRMIELTKDMRCLKCQNESLAGSHAPFAVDLRQQIREMMQDGMSNQEVEDFFVQRYGDFILYDPPLKPQNYLLWGGPFILLFLGFILVFNALKKRRTVDAVEVSAEDHRRAQELLDDGEDKQ
ncbi:cytochrome c-type biogenesis protein CcmH [Gammaproteobacteria bacterium AH-315-M22]|nr:cytochrome c-type biogenesis protein CcmH [Gammaproteobacteria bacterium AH-315-M22]